MDFKLAAKAIRDRFVANWPHVAVPLRWENEPAPLPATPASYLYVEIVGEGEGIVGYGGGRGANLWRHEGAILAHALVPEMSGTQAAYGYAEDAAAIFRGQRFDEVSCGAAAVLGGASKADNGNYWQVTCRIEFHFDRVG